MSRTMNNLKARLHRRFFEDGGQIIFLHAHIYNKAHFLERFVEKK